MSASAAGTAGEEKETVFLDALDCPPSAARSGALVKHILVPEEGTGMPASAVIAAGLGVPAEHARRVAHGDEAPVHISFELQVVVLDKTQDHANCVEFAFWVPVHRKGIIVQNDNSCRFQVAERRRATARCF